MISSIYRSYFEDDNKDRYFKNDQIEYYEKYYKVKLQQEGIKNPVKKFKIRKYITIFHLF